MYFCTEKLNNKTMNKVLTLMLALAMISMTTRAAMKKDSAKPKTEQVKKKKKDKTAKEFSNKKLYTFASKRGIMVMNAKGTGLTTLRLRPDAPEKDRSFAFLFVNGKHYLYSPTAKKFLSADGSFVDHIGSAFTFDKSQADGKFKYMLSTTNKEGQSLYVNTNGTALVKMSDAEIAKRVGELFDLRPAAIIRSLKLTQPMYQETAKYGHVGRTNEVVEKTFLDADGKEYTRKVELFTWEKLDRLDEVKAKFGL